MKNEIKKHYFRSQDMLERDAKMLSLDGPTMNTDGAESSLLEVLQSAHQHDQATQHDDLFRLLDLIGRLPRDQQEVIIYKFFYGFSDPEIGARLGKSQGAVSQLRHRAKKQLQKWWFES